LTADLRRVTLHRNLLLSWKALPLFPPHWSGRPISRGSGAAAPVTLTLSVSHRRNSYPPPFLEAGSPKQTRPLSGDVHSSSQELFVNSIGLPFSSPMTKKIRTFITAGHVNAFFFPREAGTVPRRAAKQFPPLSRWKEILLTSSVCFTGTAPFPPFYQRHVFSPQ